jgi:cytochrome P450
MESGFFIHLDPEIFPEPMKFAPERWIDKPNLSQYLVPFTKGSRACLGLK